MDIISIPKEYYGACIHSQELYTVSRLRDLRIVIYTLSNLLYIDPSQQTQNGAMKNSWGSHCSPLLNRLNRGGMHFVYPINRLFIHLLDSLQGLGVAVEYIYIYSALSSILQCYTFDLYWRSMHVLNMYIQSNVYNSVACIVFTTAVIGMACSELVKSR